jgi:hypothetical protein
MASGNILRPWQLTKGKSSSPRRAPSPGLSLGRLGEILDLAEAKLGRFGTFLPTSDEIENAFDRRFKLGIYDPALRPPIKTRNQP